ncbi:TonB-dependent siderophore receptor [Marivirga sp.]|uniref:TonB-dependent siderophore receptor n=1 Tax=Marivirga sp. TaxID=2018662 RepID=UPI003DA7A2F1
MRKFLPPILFLLIGMQTAFAQQSKITGTVTKTDGSPIEFVNVALKEENTGAVTDQNGKYTISNIAPGRYTLICSFVGYQSAEREIQIQENENLNINFSLENDELQLDEITVTYRQKNKFYRDSSLVVAKLPLKNIENPQVYNSIPKKLLEEQVVTNFNDAMKNATGVTRLWESTGRGGDGAEYFTMRGFAVQPTMINGVPSLSNGVLDPANVESIDVIKGPSGTLFGSPLVSYGGLINVTTKKPQDNFGGEFSFVNGNYNLNRIAADINTPLNDQTAFRINTAFNEQNSFQDAGFRKSFFVAPSFKFEASEKLTFLINTEFMQNEAANAPMIFLNRFVPVAFDNIDPFEKNYLNSFTSNDLTIENPTFNIQTQAFYEINDNWTSQTVISRSNAKTDGYYHYLWDLGDGDSFFRYMSKRNGETQTTDIQQNFIGDFKIGEIRNRMIVGVDYYQSNILNSSTGWVGNGIVTLSDANDTGILTQAGVDSLLVGSFEGVSTATSEVTSAYLSNVINFLPELSAMVSLRVDNFKGSTAYWVQEEVESQMAVSPKFGLVYEPIKDKISVFANYMNGFSNVAPVQVADENGENSRLKTFEPEQANQYEVGSKFNLFEDRISLTASYYNINVSNKLMSDPNNVNNSIQGGEVESKGFEFSTIANPINGLNIVAGFSKNMAEVVEDNPENGYLGLRPEEAGPSELANLWISYTLPKSSLKGLGVGFGGNYAGEHIALNRNETGSFTLPSYQIFNASLSYNTYNYSIILKVNNILDEKYYSGWSGVIPQQLRNFSINLNYKF